MNIVKPNLIEDTANEAGPTLRILRTIFRAVVLTKEQLELISKLHRMKMGFADVEFEKYFPHWTVDVFLCKTKGF